MVHLSQGLDKTKARAVMAELRSLEQKKDDAQMGVAGAYKRLKDKDGYDTQVIKMARRLDRMAPDKREVFLAEFDRWRSCLGWDDQGNLFDHTRQQDHAAAAGANAQAAQGGGTDGGSAESDEQPQEHAQEDGEDRAAASAGADSDRPGGEQPMFQA